jgi:hypothetical protein
MAQALIHSVLSSSFHTKGKENENSTARDHWLRIIFLRSGARISQGRGRAVGDGDGGGGGAGPGVGSRGTTTAPTGGLLPAVTVAPTD